MNKFYSIALSLLLGTSVGMAQDTAETTGPVKLIHTDGETVTETYYTGTNKAYDNAVNGDVIEVIESIEEANRMLWSKNLTVKGASKDVTITTWSNSSTMIAGIKNSFSVSFENLILTSTSSKLDRYFNFEGSGTATFSFKDVQIKKATRDVTVFNGLSSGRHVIFENVSIDEACNTQGTDVKYSFSIGGGDLKISGNNSFTCNVASGSIIVDGELTNEEPINVGVEGNSLVDPIIKNCTDLTKFKMITPKCNFIVKGEDIYAEASAVVVESDSEDCELNGQAYSSITLARNAVEALSTIPANVIFKLCMDQQLSTARFEFPTAYNLIIESEDAENPVNLRTHGDDNNIKIRCAGSKKIVTFRNLTIVGGNLTNKKVFSEIADGGCLTLENVTVKNLKTNDLHFFDSKETGWTKLHNVTMENAGCNDGVGVLNVRNNNCAISGETNVSISFDKNYTVNAEGWAPTEDIKIYLAATRNNRGDVLKSFTDVEKLIAPEGWSLYVDGNNIKAITKPKVECNKTVNGIELDVTNAEVGYDLKYKFGYTTDENTQPAAWAELDAPKANITEILGGEASENGINHTIPAGKYYIWAYAEESGVTASDMVCEEYNHDTATGIKYSVVDNTIGLKNDSYVIVVYNHKGQHYAMGPNGAATQLTINGDNFIAFEHQFANVTEFKHVNGVLTPKTAVAPAAKASRSLGAEEHKYENGTVTYGGATVGFVPDDENGNHTFATGAENTGLTLYTTATDASTGVDNVAVDGVDGEVEYYNLQGVRVVTPGHGLYIKCQAGKVVKVIL